MQATNWTIGVDQQAIDACFTPEIIAGLLDFLLTKAFVSLVPLAAMSVEQLQLKRYAAKILTLLYRDFTNANKTFKGKFF